MPRKASPFWFRESGALEYRDLSGDLAAYQTVMWFRKGLVCMQGPWGDTFHSDGRRTELLHYSLPLPAADGAPDGMVSADVALGWLHERLQGLSQGSTTAFVSDRQAGRIVAHPDGAHQGKILKDIVDLDHAGAESVALAFRSVDPATSDAWSMLRRAAVRDYLAPVPGSSWTLALSVPQDAVMSEVRRIQWLGTALILLGMSVLAIFVRMFLRRSLRPLQLLDDATREVAAGNLDFHLPPPRMPDEIRRLTQSFSQMQGQLREYLDIVEEETAARQRANAATARGVCSAARPCWRR